MSNPIPIYVVANGDLLEAALNAIVTVLGTSTFMTAIKISVLFSIIGAAASYIRGRDLAILAKWFITYFAVTVILLGPKVKVQVFDSSNPGAGYFVSNVPYGLAYPASLITSIAHNLTVVFDEAFHMPDEFAYNKTGMLFGSKLFRLSTEFDIEDSSVREELNEYVKNCILGDILINKKYSINDLTESTNLIDKITENTSYIRGIYVTENNKTEFKTCRDATGIIKSHIQKDAKQSIAQKFISYVFKGDKPSGGAANGSFGDRLLEQVYQHFNYGALSNSALELVTQNLLINGIRDGILNYTAESGATAALLNLSTTQAMERMRMSFATSRNIATYTIPIMHTVLLILMISLFPVVVLLAFQPTLSGQVIKNYFYTLIWLESWPLMFACLNMMTNFYISAKTASIGAAGLTMSNIDQLALEHSDVANMAGYLMLSIPFISVGLVKGMSSAFNTAASYIGGVLQSSASSAASEVATGNLHLGNSSWNNINANKFDTNSTLMGSTTTEQLKSGMLKTTMADGGQSYDSSHVLSKLPVNVKLNDAVSDVQSDQAESARMASLNDQKTYDQSISNAISDYDSFSKTRGTSQSTGETFSNRETESISQAADNMLSIATSVAKNENMSVSDAFKGLTNLSIRGDVGGDFKIPIGGTAASATGKITASLEGARINESSTQHGAGRTFNVSGEQLQKFSENLHKVEEYSKTSHAETSNSTAASHLAQMSTDLRQARGASEQYSAHMSESERLSSSASMIKQHGAQVDADLTPDFVKYEIAKRGQDAAEHLFAGHDTQTLYNDAKEFVVQSGAADRVLSNYQQNAYNIDPNRKFKMGQANVNARANGISANHEAQRHQSTLDADANKVGVDEQKFDNIKGDVEKGQKKVSKGLQNTQDSSSKTYGNLNEEVMADIKIGKEKSNTLAVNPFASVHPKLTQDEGKKK